MDDISVNCEEKFQQKEENKGQNIENWLQEEDHDDCPPNSKSVSEVIIILDGCKPFINHSTFKLLYL